MGKSEVPILKFVSSALEMKKERHKHISCDGRERYRVFTYILLRHVYSFLFFWEDIFMVRGTLKRDTRELVIIQMQ